MKANWVKDKEVEEKEEILNKVNKIISGWGLKMPKEVVLVIDFGLKDFYKSGLVEFWIANEEKEGYCGKFLFLFKNQTCPAHHHNFKHETFFIVKGKVLMKTAGKEFLMNEGDIFVMKQGMIHSFTGNEDSLILEVSKPCLSKDSIFEDKRIGEI